MITVLKATGSKRATGIEDMGFRRFMLRSTVKVEAEWMLLSLAYNLLKLHHKTQKRRLRTGLVVPVGFPAGL